MNDTTHPETQLSELDKKDALAILGSISILGGMTTEQLATVFRRMSRVSYRAGETIFAQGSQPSHIYIILSGSVKIVSAIDGTTLELVEYEPGQCFGETSVIGILPHSATALAVEDTELLILSSQSIHELYREDLKVFGLLILNIARGACRRLYKTDDILLHYATRKTK
jgi:CRP/FNR family transcriptional regulator, cyclic AMP receptor protein